MALLLVLNWKRGVIDIPIFKYFGVLFGVHVNGFHSRWGGISNSFLSKMGPVSRVYSLPGV